MDELIWDMALYDIVTGGKLGLFVEEPEREDFNESATPWDITPWDELDELDDEEGWDF